MYDASVDCSETRNVLGSCKMNHCFPWFLFHGPVESFLSHKGLFYIGVLYSSLGGKDEIMLCLAFKKLQGIQGSAESRRWQFWYELSKKL